MFTWAPVSGYGDWYFQALFSGVFGAPLQFILPATEAVDGLTLSIGPELDLRTLIWESAPYRWGLCESCVAEHWAGLTELWIERARNGAGEGKAVVPYSPVIDLLSLGLDPFPDEDTYYNVVVWGEGYLDPVLNWPEPSDPEGLGRHSYAYTATLRIGFDGTLTAYTAVPEPGYLGVMGIALAALCMRRRCKIF
jgi:hypothetical protein